MERFTRFVQFINAIEVTRSTMQRTNRVAVARRDRAWTIERDELDVESVARSAVEWGS